MARKVLFVDDELYVTEGLKRTLRKEPYEIMSANSADKALEILARQPVGIVVSDEEMPGMLGSEFLNIRLPEISRYHPDYLDRPRNLGSGY